MCVLLWWKLITERELWLYALLSLAFAWKFSTVFIYTLYCWSFILYIIRLQILNHSTNIKWYDEAEPSSSSFLKIRSTFRHQWGAVMFYCILAHKRTNAEWNLYYVFHGKAGYNGCETMLGIKPMLLMDYCCMAVLHKIWSYILNKVYV